MIRLPLRARFAAAHRLAALFLASLLFVLIGGGRALADDAAGGDEEKSVQRKVVVGFYIYNVSDLDIKARTFSLDFYLWVRFPGSGKEVEKFERIDFPNGKIEHMDEQDRQVADGETYVCWRMNVTFHQNFNLKDYPFDKQLLELQLEHPYFETKDLVYVHDDKSYSRTIAPKDRWGIRNGLTIPEWKVVGTERDVKDFVYETDFGYPTSAQIGSTYSRLTLSIKIQRLSTPYFFKIIVPLAILLAIAYLAFYIPPQEPVSALMVALFALLATVAFHMTVSANLPEVGYLVVSDKFFIATIVLIFLNLAQSVGTFNLVRKGRDELAYRIEVACRVVYPIIYVTAFALLFFMTR